MVSTVKITLLTVAAIILTIIAGTAAENHVDNSVNDRFRFFPEAGISLTPLIIMSDQSFNSLSRYISLDALSCGPLVFSFSINEILDYGINSEPFKMNRIYYDMEYINTGIETGYGRASLFIDHRCMNHVDIEHPDYTQIRWYGYGFKWQSTGMIIGNKNSGHGLSLFSSADHLNLSFSGRKAIETRHYLYDYTADCNVRFDYSITPGFIPYLSAGGEIFLPWNGRWNRSVECGIMLGAGGTVISPFAGYSHVADREVSEKGTRSFTSIGIRIEASLGEENTTGSPGITARRGVSLSPELHLRGSYSKYLEDDDKNYRSDILLAFTLAVSKNTGLFFNSSLIHSSPQLEEGTGLYPRYIDYYHETGLSAELNSALFIEPLYRYTGYGEGGTVEAGGYRYHFAGVRIRSAGMKPGYINSSIARQMTDQFHFLFNTEWELTAGWVPSDGPGKKCWMAEGCIREDIFSCRTSVFYLSLNGKIEKGVIPDNKKLIHEIMPETGLRFNRKLVMMIFYRHIKRSNENREYDINNEYHIAGVRIDI